MPDSDLMWDNCGVEKPPILSPDASAVAREVHRRATALGFTQKSLAEKAHVNDTYVRDLYKGKSKNPKGDQLERVAQALGCTVDDLRRPGRTESANSPGKLVDDPEQLALLELWKQMSPQLRAFTLYQIGQILPAPDIGKRHNG